MIIRKIFMLLATAALVGVIALTAFNLVPVFQGIDFGDPAEHFTKEETRYNLTVTTEGEGRVEGAEETYAKASSVTVTAVPDDGYAFGGWYSNNGTPLSFEQTYNFTMEKNTHLVAKFVRASS